MAVRETDPQSAAYTRVAILLHWAIAVLILFNLALGFFMEGFPPALKAVIVPMHISSGITVLILTMLRVAWRLTHSPPAHEEGLKRWERHLAHGVHFLLYAAMVLMPLTGWAILSAHPPAGSPGAAAQAARRAAQPATPGPKPGPPRLWWVLPLPAIAPIAAVGETPGGLAPQKILHDDFARWHGFGGFGLIMLLLLHVAGALKHQFVDRQPALQRIGIRARRRPF